MKGIGWNRRHMMIGVMDGRLERGLGERNGNSLREQSAFGCKQIRVWITYVGVAQRNVDLRNLLGVGSNLGITPKDDLRNPVRVWQNLNVLHRGTSPFGRHTERLEDGFFTRPPSREGCSRIRLGLTIGNLRIGVVSRDEVGV